ncbi:MAG: hypothetical protein QM813_00675 [Verrucomicrobiota bacterium]
MPKLLRISPVGVRGVVGNGLTVTHVLDFASAFGTFLPASGPVVVGRDTRASGIMMRQAVISALLACGRDVIDLGVVSTPVLQHSIQRLDAAGGISIGASHNAAEWNALKFLGPRGTYLSTGEASELLDIYHLRKFDFVEWDRIGKLTERHDAIDSYLDDLAKAFDFESLKRFKVVVDCCNGTSSLILARLNERFGFKLVLINARPEGRAFAHEPMTNARVVALQLAPLIEPLQADVGFLFDGDSDRVAIADERGQALSEEVILPLLADHQLAEGPGNLVLTNLSTTALVEEVAARRGGKVVRTAVGRQAAIDALSAFRPEQVALAGEGTGAVMLPRFRFVYDGIASMMTILTILAQRQQPLSGILSEFPRYVMLKGEAPLESKRLPLLFQQLRETYHDGAQSTLDGLRVDWPDRWFHVRVSQTEPIVRVICEKRGEAPRELFEALMEMTRSLA